MIDLYTSQTPNGWKASIMLEETNLAYEVHPISLGSGDQKKPDYLRINPNGRIPTIVDRDEENFAVCAAGRPARHRDPHAPAGDPRERHRQVRPDHPAALRGPAPVFV